MSSYDPRTPSRRPLDYVEFGPGLVDDIDRRLIGDTRRRKVLDLGCGAGHTAVGLARARVIATDSDAEQVAAAAPSQPNTALRSNFTRPVRPSSPSFGPTRSISPYRCGH